MRNRIHELPANQDLISILTILNHTHDDEHVCDDVSQIKPQEENIVSFLDNSEFNSFGDKTISMVDRSEEKLFERAPKISDIFQGTIGDCYFLSALGSIVNISPQYIYPKYIN